MIHLGNTTAANIYVEGGDIGGIFGNSNDSGAVLQLLEVIYGYDISADKYLTAKDAVQRFKTNLGLDEAVTKEGIYVDLDLCEHGVAQTDTDFYDGIVIERDMLSGYTLEEGMTAANWGMLTVY